MAQQDLTYVFQPVIHEPLSKADGGATNKSSVSPGAQEQKEPFLYFIGYDANKESTVAGSVPLSPGTKKEEEKEALQCRDDATRCRMQHPRKAMSLYLKAGKALVLCSEANVALDCFRSLIVLANDQLGKVLADKKKLPPLPKREQARPREERDRNPLSRSKSCAIPEKQNSMDLKDKKPPLQRRLSHDGAVQTVVEVVQQAESCVQVEVEETSCEFVTVVAVNGMEETNNIEVVESVTPDVPIIVNYSEESTEIVQDETPLMVSVSEASDVSQMEANEMTMSCDACVVECFEAESMDFEVATLDSSDDTASIHSSVSTEDIVRTVNAEVVMECGEAVMVSEEGPPNPQQNASIRRGYVVSELIDTEQSYIRDLGHVIKGYMAELSQENVPSDLKGKEKEIFANMQDLHEWHSTEFFKYLKECEDSPSKLGDVFSSAETKLKELYTVYCRNKPKSDSLVHCHKETFFFEIRQKLGHRLQLPDYLIKPVQRITKYQLLLRDILKFTERAGEEGAEIQRALNVALRILKRTNDMICVATIQGYEAKPEDTGELLCRESLIVAEGKSKQKSKERSVFLFEKVLLITEPVDKEGGQAELRFHQCIKTRGLGQTESVDSDPCKWAVWLRKRSNTEIYILKAPTYEIKQQWMKAITECNEKKRQGLLKSAFYRAKTFRRETDLRKVESPPTPNSLTAGDVTDLTPSPSGSRRGTVKRKTSKVGTKKKRGRDAGLSDRLKENIMRFRAEEQMLSVEPDNFMDEHTIPPSPDPVQPPKDFGDVVLQASHIEQRAKLVAEENQLKKVLVLTRMIAARLLQFKDSAESLLLYSDVIGSVLPLDDLRKLETAFNMRDTLLQQCTEIYEHWRKDNTTKSDDIEEPYTSMTSLLNETAGFSSLHQGSVWSVVLYSVSAIAGSREQRWREASQAFYRLSLVYSALQVPWCAVDSLLDAHWMCCQAGDYQGAVNFFYNAFIRALACRDLLRSLRLEQQALFLVDMLNSRDRNNNSDKTLASDSESRGLVLAQHLSFLVNMSRATRRKDWAWFEIAETELNAIVSAGNGRQADTVLAAVFTKIRRSVREPLTGL